MATLGARRDRLPTVALRHESRYEYDRTVTLGPHAVRLRPAPSARTPVVDYQLRVTPAEHRLHWQQDPLGNFVARVTFPEPLTSLEIAVDLVVDLQPINPFDFLLEPSAEQHPFAYEPWVGEELAPFLARSQSGPQLGAWLASVDPEPAPTLDWILNLNQRLAREIEYLVREEPGVQGSEETLQLGRGSCRDSACLLAEILRHLGVAARFVSGYLVEIASRDARTSPTQEGPRDSASLHAWTEAYLPGAGWVGLDPTSGLLASEGHIPLACSVRPERAAPITGSVSESRVRFEHALRVVRRA